MLCARNAIAGSTSREEIKMVSIYLKFRNLDRETRKRYQQVCISTMIFRYVEDIDELARVELS